MKESNIGKDVVFQGSGKHREKQATIVSKEPSGRYTIEFPDGTKLTEVPQADLRFLESVQSQIESPNSPDEIVESVLRESPEIIFLNDGDFIHTDGAMGTDPNGKYRVEKKFDAGKKVAFYDDKDMSTRFMPLDNITHVTPKGKNTIPVENIGGQLARKQNGVKV